MSVFCFSIMENFAQDVKPGRDAQKNRRSHERRFFLIPTTISYHRTAAAGAGQAALRLLLLLNGGVDNIKMVPDRADRRPLVPLAQGIHNLLMRIVQHAARLLL